MTVALRIFELIISDIVLNARECSARLNATLQRGDGMKVVGVACDSGRLYISLVSAPEDEGIGIYRFAELCDLSENSLSAAITERYYNGFITLSTFPVGQRVWALFHNDLNVAEECV